jgi:hypothetical protein
MFIKENNIDLQLLLKRTIKFGLAILLIKWIRYIVSNNKTEIDYFINEVTGSTDSAPIVRKIIEINLVALGIFVVFLILWKRKNVLKSKVFYFVYFVILDCIVLYLFPNVLTYLFDYR